MRNYRANQKSYPPYKNMSLIIFLKLSASDANVMTELNYQHLKNITNIMLMSSTQRQQEKLQTVQQLTDQQGSYKNRIYSEIFDLLPA